MSISTVSNALNRPGAVSEPLAGAVRAAVDALGYVPLHAAQAAARRPQRPLGMTVINIANPFFGELVSGAEDAAAARLRASWSATATTMWRGSAATSSSSSACRSRASSSRRSATPAIRSRGS